MSCCGNKRAAWRQQTKSSPHQASEVQTRPAEQGQSKVFEYTGATSLKVLGVTGKIYHFQGKGDKLQVDHQDVFAMRAERDLIVVPEIPGKTATIL
ncbi:hypothetical protein [Chryseolinea soli]|uniref:Uncharacterized protein n=1 Tax=Chryseolinea soli TaxID=2321403 RepID=A0A385SQ83_9BACT|nr:hypothetical protein [Chryseolinea soli]AYB33329.1 hypothetical protein D4L85_23285 [Chryseolinea soli]